MVGISFVVVGFFGYDLLGSETSATESLVDNTLWRALVGLAVVAANLVLFVNITSRGTSVSVDLLKTLFRIRDEESLERVPVFIAIVGALVVVVVSALITFPS